MVRIRSVYPKLAKLAVVVLLAASLNSCGNVGQPTTRMGMVKDPKTGLMFGSVIENSLVTDSSFYKNNKLKVRVRNTSGDVNFGLRQFEGKLRQAYAGAGYEPTTASDFGLLIDVNVMYSGQAQSNLASEYGFIGAAAGGIAGYRSQANAGTAIGVVAGATLGSILGSFITDDTYIIVARISFGVIKESVESKKRVTFSQSAKLKNLEDPDEDDKVIKRGFKKQYSTQVAVFAGGRNVTPDEIAAQVRERMIRIFSEFI
jgi:hypothetical protein